MCFRESERDGNTNCKYARKVDWKYCRLLQINEIPIRKMQHAFLYHIFCLIIGIKIKKMRVVEEQEEESNLYEF